MHEKAGSTEWSGILLYKVKRGSIREPENLILKAEKLFPMDIGTPEYTEYDFGGNPEAMEVYDMYGDGMDYKLGHVH